VSARGPRYKAMALGLPRYLSTRPCKLGHMTERITATGTCVECKKIKEKLRYYSDYEKTREKIKLRYSNNKETLVQKARHVRATEPEDKKASRLKKAKERQREWRKNNPGHEGVKKAKKKYKATSKGRAAISKSNALRRVGVKQAIPTWADLALIGDVYMEATYMQMQVDHIVPLRSKLVCGLHVWNNLQILDPAKNNKKGNRYWPDMPT